MKVYSYEVSLVYHVIEKRFCPILRDIDFTVGQIPSYSPTFPAWGEVGQKFDRCINLYPVPNQLLTRQMIKSCVHVCVYIRLNNTDSFYYIKLKSRLSVRPSVCLSVRTFWPVDISVVCACINFGLSLSDSHVLRHDQVYF